MFRRRHSQADNDSLNQLVADSKKLRYEILKTSAKLEAFANQLTDRANSLNALIQGDPDDRDLPLPSERNSDAGPQPDAEDC